MARERSGEKDIEKALKKVVKTRQRHKRCKKRRVEKRR